MSQASDVVTVERFIAAPPEAIFALLADPRRHRDIDGSGSVRDAKGDPDRLVLGSRFGMSMHIVVPYSMVSTVIEYEEDRRLAWQTHGPTPIGRFVAGRIWRYELEPVEGGTMVREEWDISAESPITRPIVKRAAAATRKNMEATLARIEQLVTN
ncbi:MAG: SRPBCC family protein [Mycobacterium sp.]